MKTVEFLKNKLTAARENAIYEKIHNIRVSDIRPNKNQPRSDFEDSGMLRLAENIMRYGILQPLTLRRPENGEQGYELIAGERRLRAARIAGLHEVPCIIVDADRVRSAELALVENLQREDLNIFDEAAAIEKIISLCGLTQEQAAKMLGISQPSVANKLRLNRFTPEEKEIILKNGLTERHARALLKLSETDRRLSALNEVSKKQLSVAETEALVDRYFEVSAPSSEKKQTFVIKDIRLFYNTVNKAIGVIEKAGIPVASSKTETDDEVELVIRISKKQRSGAVDYR